MQGTIFSKRAAHFCSIYRTISQNISRLAIYSMNEEFMRKLAAVRLF